LIKSPKPANIEVKFIILCIEIICEIKKKSHQKNRLHLFFSKDDDVVPIAHAEKFRKKLKRAKIKIFKSKGGHFQSSTFPEIIKMIKTDVKKK